MSRETPYASHFPKDWTDPTDTIDDDEDDNEDNNDDDDNEAIVSRPLSPQAEASGDATPTPIASKTASPTSKYASYFPSSWVLPPPKSSAQSSNVLLGSKFTDSVSNRTVKGRSFTGVPLEPRHALSHRTPMPHSFYIPRETDGRQADFRENLLAQLERSKATTPRSRDGDLIFQHPWSHPTREPHAVPPTQRPMEGGVGKTTGAEVEDVEDVEDGEYDDSLYGASGRGDVPHRAPSVAYAYSITTSSVTH